MVFQESQMLKTRTMTKNNGKVSSWTYDLDLGFTSKILHKHLTLINSSDLVQ